MSHALSQWFILLFYFMSFIFSVDAKAEIANLQIQMKSLKERNAVLEKTNQNVRYTYSHFVLINIKSINMNKICFYR